MSDIWGGSSDSSSSSSSSSEEGDDEGSKVRINKDFEARFNARNRQEELLNIRKGKSALLNESSDEDSTSEEEDEDGQLLTPNIEATVAKTLAMIRNRDPKIYEKSFKVEYGSDAAATQQQHKKKKEKPMFVKDYARYKHADDLAQDGPDSSAVHNSDDEDAVPKNRLVYNEEQAKLRQELKRATAEAASSDGSDDEAGGGGADGEDDDAGGGLFTVKRVVRAPKLPNIPASSADREATNEDDDFLQKYLSQRKWADDADDDAAAVPSYREIIDEVAEYERAEEYEKKYNFRYEESGGTEIVGHARKVEGSLRRTKDKRKLAREERRKRKEEEKKRRAEELKRLKNLKRQQIAKKLSQIEALSGSKDVAEKLAQFHAADLDDDFDPTAHDKMMQKIFDQSYYSDDDEDGAVGAVEADVQDDDDDDDDNDGHGATITSNGAPRAEKHDGETRTKSSQQDKNSKEKKQKKELPPEIQKLLDEEFQLDYEDVVGGVATRFKYKKVEPNDYGLTTEEILNATDAELRRYVSTKKIQPHGDAEWKVPVSKRRSFRKSLRERIRLEKEQKEQETRKLQKQHNKKSNKKRKASSSAGDRSKLTDADQAQTQAQAQSSSSSSSSPAAAAAAAATTTTTTAAAASKKARRHKKNSHSKERNEKPGVVSKSRLAAYGL